MDLTLSAGAEKYKTWKH